MFISTVEKEYLKDSVIGLQQEVRLLKDSLVHLASIIKQEPTKADPYGLKKDGTPKQRPGRKPLRRRA